MGKRAQSVKASPKKAKVDPVKERVQALAKFFRDEKAADMPARVRTIVQDEALLAGALSQPAGDRHAIQQIFAGAIGEALRATLAAVKAKHQAAQQVSTSAQAAEQTAQDEWNAAWAALEQANAAAIASVQAEEEAMATKSAAEKALTAHHKEESQLEKTKVKHQGDLQELEGALATATATEPPATKEMKKLTAVLKNIHATSSLINAAPSAVGKTEGFEAIVCQEIQKVLNAKLDELKQLLGQWEAHTAQVALQTTEKTNIVQAAADALASRQAEHKQAVATAEQALATKKGSDKARAQAAKAATAKLRETSEVEAQVEQGATANGAYEYLFHGPPAEPEEPEAAEAPVE